MKSYNLKNMEAISIPGEILADESIEPIDRLIYGVVLDQIKRSGSGSLNLEALATGLNDDIELEDVLSSVARLERSEWLAVSLTGDLRQTYPPGFDEFTKTIRLKIASLIDKTKSN